MQGFLPFSRASFMLDFVAIAMMAIIPLLTWAIYLVKYKKNYALHKKVLLATGVVLASTVLVFEIDMRMNGWRHLAEVSPYYNSLVFPVLYVHLFFAVNTSFLWVVTLLKARKAFPSPPVPGAYSLDHKRITKFTAGFMYGTALTGWAFYYLAFVA